MEIVGRGFDDQVLELLHARGEVANARVQNHHLVINLRQETDVSPLIGLLVNQGAQVEEVRRGKASLEEVFLKLMEEGQ